MRWKAGRELQNVKQQYSVYSSFMDSNEGSVRKAEIGLQQIGKELHCSKEKINSTQNIKR
jgi:hypothetical protein